MKRYLGVSLALGLAILSLAGRSRAADMALYGRLPSIESVDLSPDGKLLAIIQSDGEKRRVVVHDLNAKKVVAAADAGSKKVRSVQWADSDNLIILGSAASEMGDSGIVTTQQNFMTGVLLNVTTNTQKPLLSGTSSELSLNIILSAPVVRSENGQTVVYVTGISFARGGGGPTIFKVFLPGGQTRVDVKGKPGVNGYLIGQDGQVLVERSNDRQRDNLELQVQGPNGFHAVALPPGFKDSLNLLGLSQDGQSALIGYRTETGSAVAQLSPDGAWTPVKAALGAEGVLIDRRTSRFMGTLSHDGDSLTYDFADPMDQKAWRAILAAYPGERVSLEGLSQDHKRIVVLADSPTEGPTYSLVDLATGKGQIIGDQYSGLKPADVSPVRDIRYKAADGLEITGYLTLPKKAGSNPTGLPLIVLAHGGPAARDNPGFDWWSQALASEGYAVLRANFRGSVGFGGAFTEAGYGQWGKKMQTDLSDGVRYLAGEKIIDPKRVCIVGASYGGYAALAGATLDRGVYRCAASVAGPADLRKLLITDRDNQGESSLLYWNRFMGVTGVKDPNLVAISPAAHAADADIPILLIHGKDDTVVKYEQSQIMADALKKAGKPYEFVTLDGEDHWLSSGATRLQMLQSVTAFVEKNNPSN